MFASFRKHPAFIALFCLLGAIGVAGCTEAGTEALEEEVAEVSQALNCVGTCVQIYMACIQYFDVEFCAADREACKEECYANTCEPSDPGCCQGQPTCW